MEQPIWEVQEQQVVTVVPDQMPIQLRVQAEAQSAAVAVAVQKLQMVVQELPEALIRVVRMTQGSPAERESAALELIQAEVARPFDLSTAPPFRGLLVALSEHDHLLGLVFHHIVIDSWSLEILFHELTQLYNRR